MMLRAPAGWVDANGGLWGSKAVRWESRDGSGRRGVALLPAPPLTQKDRADAVFGRAGNGDISSQICSDTGYGFSVLNTRRLLRAGRPTLVSVSGGSGSTG